MTGKKRLKHYILHAYILCSWSASVCLSIILSVGRILACLPAICRAQNIVLCDEGGFGHTIMIPDMARRCFKGQRTMVLFAYWSPARHNKYAENIWPKDNLVFLPVAFQNPVSKYPLPFPPGWPLFFFDVIKWVLKRAKKRSHVLSGPEFLRELSKPSSHRIAGPVGHYAPSYFHLVRDGVNFPPIRLSKRLCKNVEDAIRNAAPAPINEAKPKRCYLYLRDKGGKGEGDSFSRSGSRIDLYADAIRDLIGRGYQTFIAGDRPLTPALREEFHGAVFDCQSLDIDPRIFSLFAASVADIAILNTGGGAWIPVLNGVPSLVVEVFPYYWALPRVTIYYKTLAGDSGRIIDPRTLFTDHLGSSVIDGYKFRPISSAEIRLCVKDFIDRLEEPRPYGVKLSDIVPDSARTWMDVANARVSPVWAKLFDSIDGPVTEADIETRLHNLNIQTTNSDI
jgi:hypothetical protein